MIDKQITVRELRDKIGRTSVIHLGSLNSTHPPMNSNTHQIRVRAGFNDLCRKHWEDAKPEAFCAVPGNNPDSRIIEICGTLTQIMRKESLHFGYALYKNEDASKMIFTQHVLEDWASMRYGLSLERSAAAVHVQGVVIASTILHKWLTYLKERRICLEAYNHIRAEFGELKQSIDLRGDM